MKHLPFPGWGRKGESLPWTGNFVPGAGGLRREQKVPAWKAGTLPTELPPPPPQNRSIFRLTMYIWRIV